MKLKHNVPVITIAQQKGGAGKTTLCVHLAVAFSYYGLKVGLIDTDPQASLTEWFKLRQTRKDLDTVEMVGCKAAGWRVKNEIERLARQVDVILVDSPPRTETEARTSIRYADLCLVPMQPSPMDLWATKATLEIAAEERTKTMLVLNRVNNTAKLVGIIREQLSNVPLYELGNRVLFASTVMDGLGTSDVAPFGPAGQEIQAMAEEVLKRVGVELVDEDEFDAEMEVA